MKESLNSVELNVVQEHILRTLLYFDIFNYPLKSEEIFRFLGTNHVDAAFVNRNLKELVALDMVYEFGEFFSVQDNEVNIARRISGNQQAEKYLIVAQRQARRISSFPFVRGVMASGSLSKGYMDESCDLDFFIVTEPGKLWIARTLLVMYKRLFLFNSHKYFCVNYFVDSAHLEIEEKNLFTATELATVLPLYDAESYRQLQNSNAWLKKFFPNYISRSLDTVQERRTRGIKNLLEKVFIPFAGILEKSLMKLTLRRWKRIYEKDYPDADFKIAFKTKKHASKNHPNHYQRKVIDRFEQKLKEFGNNHDIVWRS